MEYFPAENIQTGLASWYGPDFHGRKTSSKEIYNMYDLTAAHKSLTFGTYVMVTNLENGKSVMVRINDRGPFIKNRIIDLSYAAARTIDMIDPGIVPVKIEILKESSLKYTSDGCFIQVGAFIDRKNAENLKKTLEKKYKNVSLSTFSTPVQIYYRVRIKADNLDSARQTARMLYKEGFTPIIFEENTP